MATYSFLKICLSVLLIAIIEGTEENWTGTCLNGIRQSPINIITRDLKLCQKQKVSIQFWSGPVLLKPFGTNLKNYFPASSIRAVNQNGKIIFYDSLQYHWHTPSQHQIDSQIYDLELHFVHKINPYFEDLNTLSVIGMLFKVNNTITTDIFDSINFSISPDTITTADFNSVLQKQLDNQNFFNYQGSLTTPPCDEIVNWFVVQKVWPIKQSTFDAMKKAINNGKPSYREPQNLNGRKVTYILSQCQKKKMQAITIFYNNSQAITKLAAIVLMIIITII